MICSKEDIDMRRVLNTQFNKSSRTRHIKKKINTVNLDKQEKID